MTTRIELDDGQVDRFSRFFAGRASVRPFDFCPSPSNRFPPAGAPGALDLFFFCTAHQFGFWYMKQGRYAEPMVAQLDGEHLKGSDYLFRCCERARRKDAGFFDPARLVGLTDEGWHRLFADDTGHNPLPQWPEHLALGRRYAAWMSTHATSPSELVEQANRDTKPLARFLESAGRVPGYAEDPMQKKLQLLAVILANRPEGFLRVSDPGAYRPIIDYHLQRSALRTGLVKVRDPQLERALVARTSVSAEAEHAVRSAVYRAIEQLVQKSGCSVAALDYFFFSNRERCPEMEQPDCPQCPVKDICSQRVDLFQPVFRTTAY